MRSINHNIFLLLEYDTVSNYHRCRYINATIHCILSSSNTAQTKRRKRRQNNNNNNNKGTSFYTLLLSSNTPALNLVQRLVDMCNLYIHIYKIVTETQPTVLYLSIYLYKNGL